MLSPDGPGKHQRRRGLTSGNLTGTKVQDAEMVQGRDEHKQRKPDHSVD